MFRIIALDPGGTTGWATLYYDDEVCLWGHGQLGPEEHHEELYSKLVSNDFGNLTVVSESFEYRNQSRPGLELVSKEYIGVAKLFCEEHGVPYFEQTASQGKVISRKTGFVKKENLVRLGLWVASQGHAMDAYGHLLYYIINSFPKQDKLRLELLEKGWKAASENGL